MRQVRPERLFASAGLPLHAWLSHHVRINKSANAQSDGVVDDATTSGADRLYCDG